MSFRPGAFAARAIAVLAFGVAFGYVEGAVVVDLRTALSLTPQPVFPLAQATRETADLVAIEFGRELATLAMLAGIGWVAGLTPLERLAWAAVAFGAWDLTYYGWLRLFIGWPSSLGTWDVLFLVPVPWVSPVWAPMTVSIALIVFGLAAARRLRAGRPLRVSGWPLAGGIAGGVLVVSSFMLDAPNILEGGVPHDWAWPVFFAGMLFALVSAVASLRQRPKNGLAAQTHSESLTSEAPVR